MAMNLNKTPKNRSVENLFILSKYKNDLQEDDQQIIIDFTPFILENGQSRKIIPKVFHNQPHYVDLFATDLGLESFELLQIKQQKKRKYQLKKNLAEKEISQIYLPRRNDQYCSVCRTQHRDQYKEHIFSKNHKIAIRNSIANRWIIEQSTKIQQESIEKPKISQRKNFLTLQLINGKRYRQLDREFASFSDVSEQFDSYRKPRKLVKQNEQVQCKINIPRMQRSRKLKVATSVSTKEQEIQCKETKTNRIISTSGNQDVLNFFTNKANDKWARLQNNIFEGKKISSSPSSENYRKNCKSAPKNQLFW